MRRMCLDEFCELGYLQEVNRKFLHPLGLAVSVDGTGLVVWDCRGDEAGPTFRVVSSRLAELVDRDWFVRHDRRVAVLGYWIQPEDAA